MLRKLFLAVAALAALATPVYAQATNGKVTTSAPSYTNNTLGALSLDTSGHLRITCDSTCSGGGGGGGNVNLTGINGVTPSVGQGNTDTGTLRVVLPNDQPNINVVCTSGCVAGSGVVQGAVTTAPPSYTTGTNQPLSLDTSGNLRVLLGNSSISVTGTVAATQSGTWNVGLNAGSNVIGHVIADSGSTTAVTGNVTVVQPTASNLNANVSGTVAATQSGSWNTGQMPLAATGTTNYSLIAAATTNATSVVAGNHSLFEISLANNSSTIAYIKFYDSGSAPTCGSGTPVARYMIPAASSGGAGSNIPLPFGKAFASGIGFCITGGIADADTTAVAASTFLVNLTYK